MSNEIIKIANFMGEAFLHIWPYLLVTIPLAVAINMSGASKYIKRAFNSGPIQPLLFLRGNSGHRSSIDQWRAFGTGHVLLDCISFYGSGNLFLKCRNDRVEFSGMAPDRNAPLKLDRWIHHTFGNAKTLDRY